MRYRSLLYYYYYGQNTQTCLLSVYTVSKRKYPCTQTASAVPIHFPCLLQFCTGYRSWHVSRVWKQTKNVDLHTAKKISRYNQHFFAFFRRILTMTSDLFTVVWPLPAHFLLRLTYCGIVLFPFNVCVDNLVNQSCWLVFCLFVKPLYALTE